VRLYLYANYTFISRIYLCNLSREREEFKFEDRGVGETEVDLSKKESVWGQTPIERNRYY